MRALSAAAALVLVLTSSAVADDYGPRRDVRDVAFAAKHLIAHRLRAGSIDPSSAQISDVVVVKDQAIASWSAGTQRGLIGLVRYANRWWDAFDESAPPQCPSAVSAFPLKPYSVFDLDMPVNLTDVGYDPAFVRLAETHNPMLAAIESKNIRCDDVTYEPVPAAFVNAGGTVRTNRSETAGYDVSLHYAANDASPGAMLQSLRVRAPSTGEILLYPTPAQGAGGGTAVLFLYVDLGAKAPVAFKSGGTLDVWVPWVLDDSLRYELELYEGKTVVGPVKASVFDNVLHFDLPAFALPPSETMGEIDGYW